MSRIPSIYHFEECWCQLNFEILADYPDFKMWGVGANYGFFTTSGENSGNIRAKAVSKPGVYEVRYVTGLQHQVLARDTIIVTE